MRWTCHWSRSAQFAPQRRRQPQHNDGTSTMTTHIHQNKASSPQTSEVDEATAPVATRGSWLVDGDARRRSSSSSCRQRDDGDVSPPPTATRTAAAPSAPAATTATACLESRGVEAVAHSCALSERSDGEDTREGAPPPAASHRGRPVNAHTEAAGVGLKHDIGRPSTSLVSTHLILLQPSQ